MRLPLDALPDDSLRTHQLVRGAQLSDAIIAHLNGMKRLQSQVALIDHEVARLGLFIADIESDLDAIRARLACKART